MERGTSRDAVSPGSRRGLLARGRQARGAGLHPAGGGRPSPGVYRVAMPRFVILEHTGAPDDPAGRHYDLLLEDGHSCRTWRLAALPEPGGPAVEAMELAPHRLAWLDHVAGEVSGGRGFARRVDAGTYEPAPRSAVEPAAVTVRLHGSTVAATLEIRGSTCIRLV